MGVSENSGTPKSSILIELSIINHPFWGTPIFGNTHIHLLHAAKIDGFKCRFFRATQPDLSWEIIIHHLSNDFFRILEFFAVYRGLRFTDYTTQLYKES